VNLRRDHIELTRPLPISEHTSGCALKLSDLSIEAKDPSNNLGIYCNDIFPQSITFLNIHRGRPKLSDLSIEAKDPSNNREFIVVIFSHGCSITF